MFVETQEINAQELRGNVAEVNRSERRPVRLRVVHNVDREREAQAIILRLLLTERPSELRIEAVMARIGEPELAGRAVAALIEAGLVMRIDEYVLATAAAVGFHHLRPYMSRPRPELRSA
jgi:hypothetical protein